MKSRLGLTCILGFVLFASKASLALANEMSASELPSSVQEVQEYTAHAAKNVSQVVESIFSISQDQYTYENALKPCNQLFLQLAQNFHVLNTIAASNLPCSATASEAMENLNAFISQTLNYPYLYQILTDCSQKLLYDDKSDPFQQYIATRFINNSWYEPVYLDGSAQEKISSDVNFTLLNLDHALFREDQISDLTEKIAFANADVIYIPDIGNDDDAYDLYKALQEDYAHFIYLPSTPLPDASNKLRKSGLLIASKYSLEQLHFNEFEDGAKINEGFLDFIIKNDQGSLGHIYATHLQKDDLEEITASKFQNIIKDAE